MVVPQSLWLSTGHVTSPFSSALMIMMLSTVGTLSRVEAVLWNLQNQELNRPLFFIKLLTLAIIL